MCLKCFVLNSAWCFHSLHHWRQGKKELPSTQSLRQASKWVADCCVYSAQFSILLCTSLWSGCGRVTFKFSNLHIFSLLFVFPRQLCEKLWERAGRGRFWRQQSQFPRTQRLVGINSTCVCVCVLEKEFKLPITATSADNILFFSFWIFRSFCTSWFMNTH